MVLPVKNIFNFKNDLLEWAIIIGTILVSFDFILRILDVEVRETKLWEIILLLSLQYALCFYFNSIASMFEMVLVETNFDTHYRLLDARYNWGICVRVLVVG